MRIDPAEVEALFDAIPSVLFFAKDMDGRYTHVNQTMLRRLGVSSRMPACLPARSSRT